MSTAGQQADKPETEKAQESNNAAAALLSQGREVPKKNKAYLVHQRHLARQEAMRKAREANPGAYAVVDEQHRAAVVSTIKAVLFVLALNFFASKAVTESWNWGYDGKYAYPAKVWQEWFPPKGRIISEHELALHDGTRSDSIWLAVDGDVYDVSANPRMYGPGATYNVFAGRDASRAFVTGCFATGQPAHKNHLTYDIRGFDDKDMAALHHWRNFFKNHKKYTYVGKVAHPPIHPNSPIPEPCNDPKEQPNR